MQDKTSILAGNVTDLTNSYNSSGQHHVSCLSSQVCTLYLILSARDKTTNERLFK